MRIRRLTVKNFGKFENYAVDFNGNLAVINGQNEAGKSTIFDMIKMLLFGPGDDSTPEERMSYVRYGANEAHISGEFERADGSPLTLSRIISKHSCDLNVNENFDFQNLGDVKAPIVSDITKEVYENIYALDFHAMSAIKDDIWQGIKEEFMGADMAKELVSANEAMDKAKSRADSLYKSGDAPSVINGLLKERDQLKEKLSELHQNQKAAAEDYLNLDKTKREITDMQNKIEFENAFMQEAGKMNGLRDDVARIKTLANEAGDLSPYKQWLPNIKEEYLSLVQEKEDAEKLLDEAKAYVPPVPEEKPQMPESLRRALDYEGDIRALRIEEIIEPEPEEELMPEAFGEDPYDADEEDVVQEEGYEEPVQNSGGEYEDYRTAQDEWEEVRGQILPENADEEEVFKSLDQINTMSLAEKLELYSQSKENLDEMIQVNEQPKRSGLRVFFFVFSLIISIAFVLSGVALFFTEQIGGLISNFPPVYEGFNVYVRLFELVPLSKMITADLLCGLGLILLIVDIAFIKGKSPKAQLRNREEVVSKAREESEYNRVELEKQLFGLPIAKLRVKRADRDITDDIMKLKAARQKLFDTKKAYEGIPEFNEPDEEFEEPLEEGLSEEAIDKETGETESAQNDEIARLAELLLAYPSGDAETDLNALNSLLDEAMQFRAQLEADEAAESKNEPEAAPDMGELEAGYHKAEAKLYELESLLGEHPADEIESIEERYAKLNRAVVLRDEILEKYPNFKEVSERLNHLTQSGWPYTEDAVAKAKERINELREKIGSAQSRIGVMENSVKKALLGHDPADIASQILKLDDKIIDFKMEYDKMRLSEVIIKQGQDTFSKMHQPEVLQRASYYLSILTDGKYSELDLDSATSEITVMLEDGRYLTPQAARLSQATREQIYLSIRLSVIESFDEDREVMPITLDEALITWDKDRLTSGLNLLAQVARKRQVLIFTCHDFIVDTMKENQPTAQIIELK